MVRVIENDLKIGGFVKMCNRFFIHLEREGLIWKIRKSDYFIFYTNGMNNDSIPDPPKRSATNATNSTTLKDDTKNVVIIEKEPHNKDSKPKSSGNFKAFTEHQDTSKCKSKLPEVKKGVYQPIEMFLKSN